MAAFQNYLMGEKSLGKPPDDYEIYKLAFQLNKLPDEIRRMAIDDRQWLLVWPEIHRLAAEEMKQRAKPDVQGQV